MSIIREKISFFEDGQEFVGLILDKIRIKDTDAYVVEVKDEIYIVNPLLISHIHRTI